MAEGHGTEHDLLGQLLGLGLDHQHALAGAGEHQIELRVFQVGGPRVQHIGAVLEADAAGADRTEERQARDGQGRRGRDHGDDVRIVLQVMAQNRADDLGLVLVALGEQGTDRPVDQARSQGFLLARTALALEKAAGNLAGGEGLLLIVNGKREEILAFSRRAGADHGTEHHGIAVARQDGAIRLAGDMAGFEAKRTAAPFEFFTVYVKHGFSILPTAAASAPHGGHRGRPDP